MPHARARSWCRARHTPGSELNAKTRASWTSRGPSTLSRYLGRRRVEGAFALSVHDAGSDSPSSSPRLDNSEKGQGACPPKAPDGPSLPGLRFQLKRRCATISSPPWCGTARISRPCPSMRLLIPAARRARSPNKRAAKTDRNTAFSPTRRSRTAFKLSASRFRKKFRGWHHLRFNGGQSRQGQANDRQTAAGERVATLGCKSRSAVGSHGQYRPQAVCGRYSARGSGGDSTTTRLRLLTVT